MDSHRQSIVDSSVLRPTGNPNSPILSAAKINAGLWFVYGLCTRYDVCTGHARSMYGLTRFFDFLSRESLPRDSVDGKTLSQISTSKLYARTMHGL